MVDSLLTVHHQVTTYQRLEYCCEWLLGANYFCKLVIVLTF